MAVVIGDSAARYILLLGWFCVLSAKKRSPHRSRLRVFVGQGVVAMTVFRGSGRFGLPCPLFVDLGIVYI